MEFHSFFFCYINTHILAIYLMSSACFHRVESGKDEEKTGVSKLLPGNVA